MTRRHKWICADRAAVAPSLGSAQSSPHGSKFDLEMEAAKLRNLKSLRSSFLISGLIALEMLSGCALISGQGEGTSSHSSSQRVSQLEKILRQQRGTIDEMREKNLVLEQRLRREARATAGISTGLSRTGVLSRDTGLGDANVQGSAPQNIRGSAAPSGQVRHGRSPANPTSVASSLQASSRQALPSSLVPSKGVATALKRGTDKASGLDADDIIPVPFTPSAAVGFDIDLAKSSTPNTSKEFPSASVLGNSLVEETLGVSQSLDLRARTVAIETSPDVVLSRPHAEQDFMPESALNPSFNSAGTLAANEVSAHRPGIGQDDLSFALKAKQKMVRTSEISSRSPSEEKFATSSGNTGEHYLYSKVVNSYREHKKEELTKSTQLLLKSYPDSVFADNALYLNGLLSFEVGAYFQAEQYLNRVIREFPQGNKVVAAIFAKAMIAKKTKKFDQSESILQQVARTFPGSPEAGRVSFEIKLLKVAQTGRIREL